MWTFLNNFRKCVFGKQRFVTSFSNLWQEKWDKGALLVWVCIKSSLIHSEWSTCFMMAVISFEAASTFTICTHTSVPAALTKLQLYSITCKTTNLHNQYIYNYWPIELQIKKKSTQKSESALHSWKSWMGAIDAVVFKRRASSQLIRIKVFQTQQFLSVQIVSTLKVLIMVFWYVVKIISRT